LHFFSSIKIEHVKHYLIENVRNPTTWAGLPVPKAQAYKYEKKLELCREHNKQEGWTQKHDFKSRPDYIKLKAQTYMKLTFKQDSDAGLKQQSNNYNDYSTFVKNTEEEPKIKW